MDMVARSASLFRSYLHLRRGSQVRSTSATRRLAREGDVLLGGTYIADDDDNATTLLLKTLRNASRNRHSQKRYCHVDVESLHCVFWLAEGYTT